MRWLLVFSITLLLAGCVVLASTQQADGEPDAAPAIRAEDLTIFAAASLTDAFQALGDAFTTQNPDVTLTFNFAGSQQLAYQLAEGAPADLFASANQAQMDAAVAAGRVQPADVTIFATNELVIIVPTENPSGIAHMADLAKPGVKLVLAAPEAPIGRYTQILLERAAAHPDLGPSFARQTRANVVSLEQNVRAVRSKILLGEADAGIVYGSDVAAIHGDRLRTIAIPADLNITAAYPIAVVADSEQADLAVHFIDFLGSPTGTAILAEYGFLAATEGDR